MDGFGHVLHDIPFYEWRDMLINKYVTEISICPHEFWDEDNVQGPEDWMFDFSDLRVVEEPKVLFTVIYFILHIQQHFNNLHLFIRMKFRRQSMRNSTGPLLLEPTPAPHGGNSETLMG